MIREFKCPYGDDFEGGDECDRCEKYELCLETYPPLNLIEIPKGATNGDMFKTVFPYIGVKREISGTSDNIVVRDNSFYGTIIRFSTDWWYTIYKL